MQSLYHDLEQGMALALNQPLGQYFSVKDKITMSSSKEAKTTEVSYCDRFKGWVDQSLLLSSN